VRNHIVPHPGPAAHPRWRKAWLWLLSAAGTASCVAVLFAAWLPSPGRHVEPVYGLLGAAGLAVSLWVGWYGYRIPLRAVAVTQAAAVRDAQARIEKRRAALKLAADNPELAAELGIGRPDQQRSFDDGGLIDVNHVPAGVLAGLPGLSPQIADKIAAVRAEVGGFTSISDLEVTLGLPPGTLADAAGRLMFRPLPQQDTLQ
jgi:DNA uptake protein ComE-like DNA-binding protein